MISRIKSAGPLSRAVIGLGIILVVNVGVYQWGYLRKAGSLELILSTVSSKEALLSLEKQLQDANRHLELASDDLFSTPDSVFLSEFRLIFQKQADDIVATLPSLKRTDRLRASDADVQLVKKVEAVLSLWALVLSNLTSNPDHALTTLILDADPLVGAIINQEIPALLSTKDSELSASQKSYENVSNVVFSTLLLLLLVSICAVSYLVTRAIDIEETRLLLEQNLWEAKNQAEAASVSKSSFLSNMSHELRTPMNGVIGMANLLQNAGLPQVQRKQIAILKTSADSALSIINEILDFEAIEAGKVEIQDEVVDVKALINRVASMMLPTAQEKGIEFLWSVQPDTPKFIAGDDTRLGQILINLVSNAIKFTETGSVELDVSAEASESGESTIAFAISDTGIGFDVSKQEILFGMFQQADNSIRRKYGGTGLGLSITQSLVHMMKGDLLVESVSGVGSCFTVRLPLQETRRGKDLSRERYEAGSDDIRALSFLVVDDNPINLEVARYVMQDLGWTADFVMSGEEAIDAFRSKQYDIVLMDCHLPGLDGLETSRILLGTNPTLKIIAVTADARAEAIQSCLDSGMCGFISKPFVANQLVEAVSQSMAEEQLVAQ